MKLIYAQEAIPTKIDKSIFLAGPTLRKGQDGISWRNRAIKILEILEYDGVVFVPEHRDGEFGNFVYDTQINWESKCLEVADNILFFINRNINNGVLGLTTNDEWGKWKESGKCVLITDLKADKVRYQEFFAKHLNIPYYHELFSGIKYIMGNQITCPRMSGERFIPQHIFTLPQFQNWYKQLKKNGNSISDAKVLKSHFIPNTNKVFAYSLWCNIYIKKENRYKNNEFIFTRTDISSCVMYLKNDNPLDSEIVIVSEFRTPVRNSKGLVYELPGGSSIKPDVDQKEIMVEEIKEETGFIPDVNKLIFEGEKQICATLLTHKSHLFSYELTQLEYDQIKNNVGKIFGNIEDTERTELHIFTVKEILDKDYIDWSNIGQIMKIIYK